MSKHRNYVPTLDATGTGKPKFGLPAHRKPLRPPTPWNLSNTELGIQFRQVGIVMASLIQQGDVRAYKQVVSSYVELRKEYNRRGLLQVEQESANFTLEDWRASVNMLS